jgi:hypothetical protein
MKKYIILMASLFFASSIINAQCIQFTTTLTTPNGTVQNCSNNQVNFRVINTVYFPPLCPGVSVFADIEIERQGSGAIWVWPTGDINDYYEIPASFGIQPGTYRVKARFSPVLGQVQIIYSDWVTVTYPPSSLNFTINYNSKTNQLNPYNICGNTPITAQVSSTGCLTGTFLSVQECNQWASPIGPEINQWFWPADNPNGKLLDVRQFCQNNNFPLQQGKYYRIKVASGTPWTEYVRIIFIENASNAQAIPYFNLFSTPWFGNGSSSAPQPIVFPSTVYALSSPVWMHGAGTTCENKYIITVEEANQWWGVVGSYQWSRLWDGFQVPNDINIQALCELYAPSRLVTLCNGSSGFSKRMIAGNLPPNDGGGARHCRISLATMELGWQSITALVRFQQNCEIGGGGNPRNEPLYDFPEPEPESVWNYSHWQNMNAQTGISNEAGLHTELYPNPATNFSTLKVSLNTGVRLHVTVTDMNGRVLMRPFAGEYKPAGQHLLLLQADLFPAQGIYFIRIEAGSEARTEKLIIRK